MQVAGCMAENACNYDASATEDDGTCDYCSCGDEAEVVDFPLVVETCSGRRWNRVPLLRPNARATDRMSAVFGNDQASL